MSLQLHSHTKTIVGRLTQALPHAVLLSGAEGIGLHTIATFIAKQHTKSVIDVTSTNDSIGIEVIRELYAQLRTRPHGSVVVIIDDAEKMTPEAQNAFLKLLEEPGQGIAFILASHAPTRLLPTVLSRAQQYQLQPAQASEQFITSLANIPIDATKKKQIAFIAAGLPAEIVRLIRDKDYFALAAATMRSARQFLEADNYGKLLIIHATSADRIQAQRFARSLEIVLRHTLERAPATQTAQLLLQVLEVQERLLANGHPRTQLLRLIFE
ncbi:MAG TPA: AAA family ATPase [Verrucomicrobiae bacterium]|nr:AAA family ATPase [Verrucomicrobiae bacterium]